MKNNIYETSDTEYQSDGFLIVEEEEFYSIKTFKETFAYMLSDEIENNEIINDKESQELQKKVNRNDIKKCESLNSKKYPFIYCFRHEDLLEYFSLTL